MSQGEFTKELWKAGEERYQRILEHPFLKELKEGTLSQEVFAFYIGQDSLYLKEFGRALALLGARSERSQHLLDFAHFAASGVEVERSLHEDLARRFGISERPGEMSPTCRNYTGFLLSTCALKDVAEGVAAVLPCFWIYREVGAHIHERSSAENPYKDWIDMYVSEEFDELVRKALGIANELAEEASGQLRERMKAAFAQGTRYEWMFWDSAYRLEQWPV
jgi:thiaminase/transcriptional activator TenA